MKWFVYITEDLNNPQRVYNRTILLAKNKQDAWKKAQKRIYNLNSCINNNIKQRLVRIETAEHIKTNL